MNAEFHITGRHDGPKATATCALCRERFPLEDIMGHIRGAHDLDIEVAEWPDGGPVIIDQTLEPDSFGGDSRG